MTRAQLQKARAKAKREKLKAQRVAVKARKAASVQRRKAKRAAKAAPRNRLAKWSKRVREAGACAVCGATENLNAHHLLPKERYPEFKFKMINGIALCPRHHKFDKFIAHRNPIWFAVWLHIFRPSQYDCVIEHMGDWNAVAVNPQRLPGS
jgi:5-methylcytosine-specific restriction endonuclease McrA